MIERLKRILLVDEDAATGQRYAPVLRESRYAVSLVGNAADALGLLTSGDVEPCLVLLDILVPPMTHDELRHIVAKMDRVAGPATRAPGEAAGARSRFLRRPLRSTSFLPTVHAEQDSRQSTV